MKLDISKITDNVVIHCPKKEYVRPLFEAMRWDDVVKGEKRWREYQAETCFRVLGDEDEDGHTYCDEDRYTYCDKDFYIEEHYTIIPFEDLIIPEESNLAKALGVKEGQQFKWDNPRYANIVFKITDGFRWVRHASGEWSRLGNEIELCQMIADPSKIKPIPIWTPEEQEMAKKDSFRFNYVTRDATSNAKVTIWKAEPEWNNDAKWFHAKRGSAVKCADTDYPSLQPGECVSLEEIAGGGE